MPTIPYLHFQGDCAAALAFYAEVFTGTDLRLMHYAQAPGASDAWQASALIMHGEVKLYGETLMASDFPPGQTGEAQKATSIMQTVPDVASGQVIFDRLATGGAIIQPYGPHFVSPGFGMVKDKFGTHWIISALAPQEV